MARRKPTLPWSRREQVPIERLDALAKADGFVPDVLKIDVQGGELQVLAGAETSLASTLLAEVEVSYFTRYVGQPLFGDIANHMEARGFELIDLLGIKRTGPPTAPAFATYRRRPVTGQAGPLMAMPSSCAVKPTCSIGPGPTMANPCSRRSSP